MMFANADEMIHTMVSDCLRGQIAEARGREMLEVKNWHGVLLDPMARIVHNPARDLRLGYPAASVAWNLAERDDVESICWWNEKGRAMSDDGETFHGANYGQRFMPYLMEAMNLIEADIGTRRAWVPIWKPSDLATFDYNDGDGQCVESTYSREGRDVPCTLGFELSTRGANAAEPTLDMSVVMRSQSAWAVFPYDVYFFAVLQELIAREMGFEIGHLSWYCISLHVYRTEVDWVTAGNAHYDFDDAPDFESPAMEPILATLGEAQEAYPRVFDELIKGETSKNWMNSQDPVIRQMAEGASEIRRTLVAKK